MQQAIVIPAARAATLLLLASFFALGAVVVFYMTPEYLGSKMPTRSLTHADAFSNIWSLTSKIVHVVNIYGTTDCDEAFCPFDQGQSVALESMLRSKDRSSASVILAAVTFPEDESSVPSGFFRLPHLTRSTASDYPYLPSDARIPFVQDIFDSLLKSEMDFEYAIYTNSDIVLSDNFYDIVQEKIRAGLDAFTINRQSIPEARADGTLYTKSDLDEIYSLTGRGHPGSDCFVLTKKFLQMVNLGNAFLGFQPWDVAMKAQLQQIDPSFRAFRSHELRATYHLGRQHGGRKPGGRSTEYTLQNFKNVFESNRNCLCHEFGRECLGLYKLFRRTGHNFDGACFRGQKNI